jgi:hypothetical protein
MRLAEAGAGSVGAKKVFFDGEELGLTTKYIPQPTIGRLSEAGWYVRLIDFLYHSPLGSRAP